MTKRSRHGLRRLRLEVRSWGNYVEQIAELQRLLAKKPRTLHIEIIGTGEIPADTALRFRAALMGRSPKTRIVTNAHSTIQGGTALLWLLGDTRTIRDGARVFFRRTTFSEEDEVQVNEEWSNGELSYRDSYSTVDPDEGDYARVLQIIDEYLPVEQMAGRLIGVPVLREFGLLENEQTDRFLAAVFSKSSDETEGSRVAQRRLTKRAKTQPRVM